jgi:hypothetical protein
MVNIYNNYKSINFIINKQKKCIALSQVKANSGFRML